MAGQIYNPFGSSQPAPVPDLFSDEDPNGPARREIHAGLMRGRALQMAEMDRQAKIDPLDAEIKATNERRTNLRYQHQGMKNQLDDFLKRDGADLFETDALKGTPVKNPDGTFMPKLGAEVESLRQRAGGKTGLIAGALSPSRQAGDPTPDAVAARQRLAEIEPTYRMKQEKFDRIHNEMKRLEQADLSQQGRLAQLGAAREARFGQPMYGTPGMMPTAAVPSGPVPSGGVSPAADPYETALPPAGEAQFQAWKKQNAPNDSGADYDLRGAFAAGVTPDASGHWPDTFKKPNHPTFSTDSMYAKDRPDLAGTWQGDTFVPPAGAAAAVTPASLVKAHAQLKAAEASGDIAASEELRAQLEAGMAQLDPDRQQRVMKATKDPGFWEKEGSNVVRGGKVALGQTMPLVEGVAGLAGATAEKFFGKGGMSSAVKDWGFNGYKEGMAKLEPLAEENDDLTQAWKKAKEGNVGALVDWASYGLGYLGGQMGETALMSVVGGMAGSLAEPGVGSAVGAVGGAVAPKLVRTAATNMVEKWIAKEAGLIVETAAAKTGAKLTAAEIAAQVADPAVRKLASKSLARTVGATAAIGANAFTQELGSIYPEAVEQAAKDGHELSGSDLARVWATGIAAGGLETITDKLGLDVALGKVKIPGAQTRLGRAALGAAGGIAVEGGTEVAQTGLERVGAGQSLADEEAVRDYINSGALGALGGAVVGGGGGLLHGQEQPPAAPGGPATPGTAAPPAGTAPPGAPGTTPAPGTPPAAGPAGTTAAPGGPAPAPGTTPPTPSTTPPAAKTGEVTLEEQQPKTFEFTNDKGATHTVVSPRESEAVAQLPTDFGPIRSVKRVEPAPTAPAAAKPPATGLKPIPPDWRVTVQQPQPIPGSTEKAPGFVQIDKIGANGEGQGSVSPEQLRAEGYDVPANLAQLPQGQHKFGALPPPITPGGVTPPSAPTGATVAGGQGAGATGVPPAPAPAPPMAPPAPKPAVIARGTNTPNTFIAAVAKAGGLKAKDKATRFLSDFAPRLHKANSKAFSQMEVHVLNQAEWDAHPNTGTATPDSAAAYNPETNTLFLNADRVKGNNGVDLISAVVHESGHFAEKFALGEALTQREWAKLTHEQRVQARKDYDGQDRSADPVALLHDKRSRAEWAAMQFARVVRGDTAQMPANIVEKMKAFLETVRELVRKWVGAKSLTTPELDSWILDKLGYAPRAAEAPPPVPQPGPAPKPPAPAPAPPAAPPPAPPPPAAPTPNSPNSPAPPAAPPEAPPPAPPAVPPAPPAHAGKPPAPPAPKPPEAKPGVSSELQQLGDELFGSPPAGETFNRKFDPAKIDAANKFVSLIVREHPEVRSRAALARFITEKFPKARTFSDSIFRMMGGFADLDESGSFADAFRAIDNPAPTGETPARDETRPDKTGLHGQRDQGTGAGGTPQAGGGGRGDQTPGNQPHGGVLAGEPTGNVQKPGSSEPGGTAGVRKLPVGGGEQTGVPRGGEKPVPDVQRGDGSGVPGNVPDGTGGRGEVGGGGGHAPRPDVAREPSAPGRSNYRITDPEAIVGGGPKARFTKNRRSIETYLDLTAANREPSAVELDTLAGYTGWGSFGQELFQGSWDRPAPKEGWEEQDRWLRDHLGREEWESAQRSIINAHYTDPITVSTMWEMVRKMGFTGGRVLEPGMGIGNFFGLMPADFAATSQLTGIELDRLTGGMAKILYPESNIQIKGYENSKTSDNFYDLVIGNWPFANVNPADRRYDKFGAGLHDYYFLKALDQVRPGGVVIGITSNSSFDRKSSQIRTGLARKGELIAAYRLPAGAFQQYAGTKVVTDIVVLRKRAEPISALQAAEAGWINLVEVDTPSGEKLEVNEYWQKNPTHILGRLNFGSGTTTGRPGMIVERPTGYEAKLRELAQRVPAGVFTPWNSGERPITYVANQTKERQNAIVTKDKKFYQVRGEHLALLDDLVAWRVKSARETERRAAELTDLIGLRGGLTQLLYDQSVSSEDLSAQRAKLKERYDAFVAKHGPLQESAMLDVALRAGDIGARLLKNVEEKNAAGQWVARSILTTDIVRRAPRSDNLTIEDAYAVDRYRNIHIDPARIAELARSTEEEVIARLSATGQVFRTPAGVWEARDQYLSGNVRQKMREAEDARSQGLDMARNIEALKTVIPKDVPYLSIEPGLGATWVRNDYYKGFISHLLGLTDADLEHVTVELGPRGYKIDIDRDYIVRKPEATTQWGTPNINWRKLIDAAFNNGLVKIKAVDAEGNEYTHEEFTRDANAKISAIREEFKSWIWKDPPRAIDLQTTYNETFNSVVTPDYDGAHLQLSGLAMNIGRGPFDFRAHQKNAVWRFLVNGRGVGAHEVGTGKTFTMAGLALESRRLGLFRKPLIFAHNANSASVAGDIQMAYPGAKVLYVDNLSPEKRDATLQQISLDEWDAVVMPHSLIDRVTLREETMLAQAAELIRELEQEAIDSAQEDDGVTITVADMDSGDYTKLLARKGHTAKELVKQRARILERIRKQAQKANDDSVFFEDMGVDAVMVDEAHIFKKIPIASRQQLKGLNKSGSDRSVLLTMLTDYVKSKNGGKGTFLFTGTPITNTVNEAYNMMRYVMDDTMDQDGVKRWDAWFNAFADSQADVELTAGGRWEPVERLTQFVNVPELARMAAQVFDVVFAKNMPEFTPRATKDGRDENGAGRPYKQKVDVVVPMSPQQVAHLADIHQRAAAWKAMSGRMRVLEMRHGGPRSPLIIEGEGVKSSLDYRLMDLTAEDDPGSKTNRMLETAMKHYGEHPQSTQMIFMDRGYYDTVTRSRKLQDGSRQSYKVPAFNLAKDIVEKLVARGVPRDQIAVFPWLSKKKRKAAAEAMQLGEIRFGIGGTETMGTGVNAQNFLRAMHHLDAPWMPGELEQRNGRGWRQGNTWNTVLEYRYFTEGSHDGRRWQILLTKDKFIRRFVDAVHKKGESGLRIIDGDGADLSEGSNAEAGEEADSDFSESFSAAVGDPRILQRAKLQRKIEALLRKQTMHIGAQRDAAQEIGRQQDNISRKERVVAALEGDIATYAQRPEQFSITIEGKTYTDRKKAEEALSKVSVSDLKPWAEKTVGEFAGFKIIAARQFSADEKAWKVAGETSHEFGGSVASLEAILRGMARLPEKFQEEIASTKRSVTNLQSLLNTPFTRQALLDGLRRQLDQITQELAQSPAPPPGWLRDGAPVGSMVVFNGGSYDVAAHRWDATNWWLLVTDPEAESGALIPVPYDQAMDADGNPLFEKRAFTLPGAVAPEATPPPAPANRGPARTPNDFRLDEVVRLNSGQEGLWRIDRITPPADGSDNDALWSVEVVNRFNANEREVVAANNLVKPPAEELTSTAALAKPVRPPQLPINEPRARTPRRNRLQRMLEDVQRKIDQDPDAVDENSSEKRMTNLNALHERITKALRTEDEDALRRARESNDFLGTPSAATVEQQVGEYRAHQRAEIAKLKPANPKILGETAVDYDKRLKAQLPATRADLDFVSQVPDAVNPGSDDLGLRDWAAQEESDIRAKLDGDLLGAPPVRGSPAEEAVMAKVNGTLEDKRTLLQRFRDYLADLKDYMARELRQKLLDSFASIQRLERATFGTAMLDASVSAYKAARMTKNLPSVMNYLINHGTLQYRNGSFSMRPGADGGLMGIFKPLIDAGTLHLWEGYATAFRADSLLREGRETNFGRTFNPATGAWTWNAADARREINTLLALGRQYPEFERVRQNYVAFQKSILDVAEASGLISTEQRATWEKSDYVPFYRITEALDSNGPRKRRGIADQRSGIRRLKGAAAPVAIMENIVRNIESLVDASFKNVAMQRVADLAQGNNDMLVRIPYKAVPLKASVEEVLQKLEEAGVDTSGLSTAEAEEFVKFWRMRAPKGKDVVSVMVDGRPIYYRVKDAPLLRSVQALGPRVHSWWMNVLMAPKHGLTAAVTLDPAFMVANTIRDSFSAWVIADSPIRPGFDAVKGFVKSLRNDPAKLAILAGGGGSGHYNNLREGRVRDYIRQLTPAARKSFLDSVIDTPKKLARLYADIGRASENANRIAIAESAKKRGATDSEAAFQALDIMDFGLRGDSGLLNFFLDTVPFLNARIQGLYKLGRAVTAGAPDDKILGVNKRVATHGAVIIGATAALLASNWDDDRYWELPEWERDIYYHFWLGGQHIRIPKPFEVGQIFSTIPERLFEFLGKTGDAKLLGKRLLNMLSETFAMNPIPQMAKPLAERAANLNTFTGRPIISRGDEFKQPEQQFNVFTSDTMRELAKAMPDSAPEWMRSPKTLEHFVRGYFGSIGMYALTAADAMVRAGTGAPAPPAVAPGDFWVMKRFAPSSDLKETKYVSQFYDLHQEIAGLVTQIKELQKTAPAEARKVMAENAELVRFAPRAESAYKAMQSLRNQEKRIYESAETPEEKRRRLGALAVRRNVISQQTMLASPRRPSPVFNPFSN